MTMNRKPGSEYPASAEGDEDRGVLDRWSERKLRARNASRASPERPAAEQTPQRNEGADLPPEPELTDADMPPLESLDEHSDFSGFLSPKVSEDLRRLALRKLFRLPKYNVSDGLDDYAGDFTGLPTLGSILTQEMRRELEREQERFSKKLEEVKEQAVAGSVEESPRQALRESATPGAQPLKTEKDDPPSAEG